MSNTIGIIGCGWLGLPLATSFVEAGYEVHGSTTSKEKISELKGLGIKPFLVTLSENRIEGDIDAFLSDVSILIINVPPKLRGNSKENYELKMQLLHQFIRLSSIKKIIFVSSTSVYGDIDGVVTEASPTQPNTESGKQLVASEHLFQNDTDLETTIVRFGGLIGVDRHPVNHLAGRKELANGNEFINLIHLNDCIRILKLIVEKGYWNAVFNAVYPDHPIKASYYTREAQKRGLKAPEYVRIDTPRGKKIDSYQLIRVKKFDFHTDISN